MMSTSSDVFDAIHAGKMRSRTRLLRLVLLLVLPLAAVLAGATWYLLSGRYVSTDDAYVQADIVSVSSDVAGRVTEIDVHDNERVHAGQVLFRLDDRPYRIAVEHAQAQLASARLEVDAMRASYRQKLAELQAAEDALGFQRREFDRQQTLLAAHVASQRQFDQARNNLDAAQAQVASGREQIANILASLGGDPNIATDRHPLVEQAQARLDQAKLDLSHTVIAAAQNGIVTRVDKLAVGDYLNAATAAFSLVGTDRLWIEANFKETQLAHMQPGQTATITADTYADREFSGEVASVSPGTGSQFSVLPPQNATGNWVKVVQRLPVRIALDDPQAAEGLRAGMSVTVDIDTEQRSPLLARLGSFIGKAKAAPDHG
jgi:membrane fusion protein, multidrug efflux system